MNDSSSTMGTEIIFILSSLISGKLVKQDAPRDQLMSALNSGDLSSSNKRE